MKRLIQILTIAVAIGASAEAAIPETPEPATRAASEAVVSGESSGIERIWDVGLFD